MKREDFIKIIQLRSCWKIDKRKGNYKLPSGDRLDSYVYYLVHTQLTLDSLGISKNGNIYTISNDKKNLFIPFDDDEETNRWEQYERVNKLVFEIIG